MNRFFTLCLVPVLCIIVCDLAKGDLNTPLTLKDGKLSGLPKKYSPASFDLNKLSLTINGKSLVFPSVLRGLLMHDANEDPFGESPDLKPRPYAYEFTASWHQGNSDESKTPCLWILIRPKNKHAVYELSIDMDKLEFIYAHVIIVGDRIPIDLDGIPDNPKKKSG